jgi:hypothetical protein
VEAVMGETEAPEDAWARRAAALDARLAPIAHRKAKLGLTRAVDEAGVRPEAEALLRELLDAYAAGDDARRSFIRSLFRTYGAFAWAATLPGPRATPEGLRLRLLHFSVKDQDRDPRDATLWLDAIVGDARKGGVDLREVLAEVAELSSTEDRYGWGPTRDWLLKRLAGAGSEAS